MYTLQVFISALGIVAAVCLVLLTPLVAVFVARSLRHELDLMKDPKHRKAIDDLKRQKALAKIKNKGGKHRPGAPRMESVLNPIEDAKREMREKKEQQAREDAFFTEWWMNGKTGGLERVTHPLEHPAFYSDMPTEIRELRRQIDKPNDDKIMSLITEGTL